MAEGADSYDVARAFPRQKRCSAPDFLGDIMACDKDGGDIMSRLLHLSLFDGGQTNCNALP